MEFYSVDPWDERRADLRDATNTSIVVNELRNLDNTVRVIATGMGAKMKLRRDVLHPRDLIPVFDPEEREREREQDEDKGGRKGGGDQNGNGNEIEARRKAEYAARFFREQQAAKALLGLGEGIRPGAMEPVMVGG